jgi:hypothetical protein
MRKIKISLVGLAFFVGNGLALAGNISLSRVETQEFYVDNSGMRIATVYPSLGFCTASRTEICSGTYSRVNPNSPWVLQGTFHLGRKPF